MTEAKWLACMDPAKSLPIIRGRVSNRKLRLFACACCQRLWEWMEPEQREQVQLAEALADGRVSPEACSLSFGLPDLSKPFALSSRHFVNAAAWCLGWPNAEDPDWKLNETAQAVIPQPWGPGAYAEFCTWKVCDHASCAVSYHECHPYSGPEGTEQARLAGEAEAAMQVELLREIVGNPFRPVVFEPGWRTEVAVALASRMYEARDFFDMPILADALQDAGCDHDDILSHCRGPGTHVRGCWVIDLILGKA